MASIVKKITFILLFVFFTLEITAQSLHRPFHQDVRFIQYLQNTNQFSNSIIAINQIPLSALKTLQKDTLNYLKGWAFYHVKSLDSSANYLLKVRQQSGFYIKSRFFGAYNLIYLKHYDRSDNILKNIPLNETTGEVKHFERAGIALLQNNYPAFDSLEKKFSYNNYALIAQEKRMAGYREQLSNMKKKSPLLAGIMSAIIPGTGKIYAGKTLQGIGSMLPMAALGLLTYESYHKSGSKSIPFYIFGSLFTIYYIGNIWGSVFAVKITSEEHEKLIHQKILLDLQIPLRTIFN